MEKKKSEEATTPPKIIIKPGHGKIINRIKLNSGKRIYEFKLIFREVTDQFVFFQRQMKLKDFA